MKTIRLTTTAQALVWFLNQQYVYFDGKESKFVEGIFTNFGSFRTSSNDKLVYAATRSGFGPSERRFFAISIRPSAIPSRRASIMPDCQSMMFLCSVIKRSSRSS